MTLAQVEKRLVALEKRLGDLQETLDYQQAVEAIRRGLDSADRGASESVSKTFGDLRRKHGLTPMNSTLPPPSERPSSLR